MLLQPLHVLLLRRFDLRRCGSRRRGQSLQRLRLRVLVGRHLLSPGCLLEDVRVGFAPASPAGRVIGRVEISHGVVVAVTNRLELRVGDFGRLLGDDARDGGFDGDEQIESGEVASGNRLACLAGLVKKTGLDAVYTPTRRIHWLRERATHRIL